MWRALVIFYLGTFHVEKTGISIRGKYGNIFRDVLVCLASVEYVLYVSLNSFIKLRWSVKE